MVEKILNIFSKKVLIGLIISLLGICGTGAYYIWDLKTCDNSGQLTEKIQALELRFETLQTELSEVEIEARKADLSLKEYINKNISFVVKNSEGKNKEIMLQVLELTKDLTQETKIEYMPMPQPIQANVSNVVNTTIVNKEMAKDTVKKGLLKRVFNL